MTNFLKMLAFPLILIAISACGEAATAVPTPTSTTTLTPTATPTFTSTPTPSATPTASTTPTSTPTSTLTPTPSPTPTREADGTLTGRVSIGPLCPVEPCEPTSNPYIGRELLLYQNDADPVRVPLTDDGAFESVLPAATYSVELSDCNFLGCSWALPTSVTVLAGDMVRLDIDIDTGIRSPVGGPAITPTPTTSEPKDPAPCEAGQRVAVTENGEYLCQVVVLAPIDAVEVQVRESYPPQYVLRVVSGLPNGCTRFDRLEWQRDGTAIEVQVFNLEPANQDIVCTMIYGNLEHTIELGTDFQSGETYTVTINDKTESFVTQ